MDNFRIIQLKLEAFIRRFYVNELLKGGILFFAIGLLYFLFTLFIEYVLWLDPLFRTVLFWVFILIEVGLFARFILWPLAKLFKLHKGLNYDEASQLIGKHFPQVDDKLLNVLQLHRSQEQSELLLASIDQKAAELKPVPFQSAVNFSKNKSYLKYAAVPLILIAIIFISGNSNFFSESYQRVVNHNIAYEPPAPFQFFILNENLRTIENKDYKLQVKTSGKSVPDVVQIKYNGESYFLNQLSPGSFEFVFPNVTKPIAFNLSANAVTSKTYQLELVKVPAMVNFEMVLNYPEYTKRPDEILKSNGSATIPEGTTVTWKLKTRATENVVMYAVDTLSFEKINDNLFELKRNITSRLDYSISTSNQKLENYENLDFSLQVVKDAYPELMVKVERDSVDMQSLYFYGQASDDYGLTKLQLIYYPADSENEVKASIINIGASGFEEFLSAFPNDLKIEAGRPYELYFQVFDNDALHNHKSVKSQVFTYQKRTVEEEERKQLQEQGETIKNLDNSFEKMKLQEQQLQELSRTQKEKELLSFSDKQKLANFIKRQKEQEALMQNFNKQLRENLENFQKDDVQEDVFKEDLKERLKDNEGQLQEDEKLLKELERLQEKMQKEELTEKLDELSKQNKNKKRSLEQLLELTKRYYVAKKAEKLQRELESLSREQQKLSEEEGDKNNKEAQDKLNSDFKDLQKELEELQKDNKDLKKPIDLLQDEILEKEIENDQREASELLKEKEQSNKQGDDSGADKKQKDAQKKQKDASRKMQEMSTKMSQSMMSGGQQQLKEDASMLRQILDNLLLFSFEQEDLMDNFKSIQINHNRYGQFLRKQSSLREHFSHIDDSLFALSLRQPKLSENINSKISDVYFNIDKAMDELSENLLYKGISSQQFTVSATNELANFLSDILDNMESDMNGQGQGEGQGQGKSGGGKGMQLPDIIMSQEELNKQMEKGLKKSESGTQEGENKDGDRERKGENGEQKNEKEGEENGKDGKDSESMNGELYEIYQQQQKLRQALQDKMGGMEKTMQGQQLLKQMEQIEMDLINNGFTNQTLQRMLNLQHQLLKLENATFLQGEENKRESNTNKKDFDNTSNNRIPAAKEYFNTTEILNRQALPLRQIYKKKVQEYFKQDHD